ncbi:MAG: hypothetical protein PHG58_08630 [Clostridia bacterium]|nr:hypothetical protein [Clostridia bacterium]
MKGFFDYLAVEEQNLLTSLVRFPKEIDMFAQLDWIYQFPMKKMTVPEEKTTIASLYLLTHYNLYFSYSCMLRSHLSDSLSAMRTGIDATFTAYRLIKKPDSIDQYLQRKHQYLRIKATIKDELKKDPSLYPLAPFLINLHEACSQYGSHADIDSFFHRFEIVFTEIPSKIKHNVHYFQFPDNPRSYRFYLTILLKGFYTMFLIYEDFIKEYLTITEIQKWEETIRSFQDRLQLNMQVLQVNPDLPGNT